MQLGENPKYATQSQCARWRVVEVAWGWCGLRRSEGGLSRVSLPAAERAAAVQAVAGGAVEAANDPLLSAAAELLMAYFAGRRVAFDLPLDLGGRGDFTRAVLEACAAIPWGVTRTYGELAAEVGSPRAARAVGQALGRNPLPVLIPCHRVIGADGRLVGFGSGLALKRRLLEHEGICGVVA